MVRLVSPILEFAFGQCCVVMNAECEGWIKGHSQVLLLGYLGDLCAADSVFVSRVIVTVVDQLALALVEG